MSKVKKVRVKCGIEKEFLLTQREPSLRFVQRIPDGVIEFGESGHGMVVFEFQAWLLTLMCAGSKDTGAAGRPSGAGKLVPFNICARF